MNFTLTNSILSLVGTLVLVTLGLTVAKILSMLRQQAQVNQAPRLMPSRTVQALVITASVLAMLCAAARAWQLTLVGH